MTLHTIILMKYRKNLESVGLTNHTDDLRERISGQRIIPIGEFNDYQEEVSKYTKEASNIYQQFINQDIKKAISYCKNNNLNYSICKD